MSKTFLAILILFSITPSWLLGQVFPRLLPPPSEFQLTLREDPNSTLPLGPSCGGEAGLTLNCRAFSVTLKNIGTHAVRIVKSSCAIMPEIRIIDQGDIVSMDSLPPSCNIKTTNLRLRPGESIQHAIRLLEADRVDFRRGQPFAPGAHALHAEMVLFGCAENPEGTECAATDAQDPVWLSSDELKVQLPPTPIFDAPKVSLEITSDPDKIGVSRGHCTSASNTVDCVAFHYKIRNLGKHAVRHSSCSCCGNMFAVEYRPPEMGWDVMPEKYWQQCSANMTIVTTILSGGAIEGDFTLADSIPGYRTESLGGSGEYQFRFTFHPILCVASPDARFCLSFFNEEPNVVSNEVTVKLPTSTH